MTAALRTAYFYITGTELGELNFREIEGLDGIKEAEVEIASKTIRIAVAHGTGNVEKVLERIRAAKAAGEEIPYHSSKSWPAAAAASPAADNRG